MHSQAGTVPADTQLGIPAMHYRRVGTGPAMVLLHGFPDNGSVWNDIAATLAADYTLYIPDLPGAGSSPLTQPASLAQMAVAVRHMLIAGGVARAVVVGHSMGGYVALAFARLYPQVVAGLSMVHSTPAADDDEKKAARTKVIDLILKGGKATFIRQMTANLFAPQFRAAHPDVVAAKEKLGMQLTDDGLINFYRAMIGRDDNTAVVTDAPFPLQWIAGAEDAIVNYMKTLNLCHYSNVNFVTLYSECGHISMIENPAKLVADLSNFGHYCFYNHRGA